MAKLKEREVKTMRDLGETFTLDGAFIKREAKDALKSYFIPFSGIYAAATGRKVVIIRDKAAHQHEKKKS